MALSQSKANKSDAYISYTSQSKDLQQLAFYQEQWFTFTWPNQDSKDQCPPFNSYKSDFQIYYYHNKGCPAYNK